MTRSDWKRVSKRRPCLVCDRPDWCLYAGPADSPTAAICMRRESARPMAKGGWWHRLRDDGWRPDSARRVVQVAMRPIRRKPQDLTGPGPGPGSNPISTSEAAPAPAPDLEAMAAAAERSVSPTALQGFARGLGLTVEALRRLRVGWLASHRAWSFPMTDAAGAVLGIRLRRGGAKFSVTGGHDGLFLPEGLDINGARLVICEGPTDTAALLDLGFSAAGRPSCTGGVSLLIDLAKQRRPAEIDIFADRDAPKPDGGAPGLRGAETLAAALVPYVAAVRIATPPDGIKDARAWKQSGATAADVAAVIDAAPIRRLAVVVARHSRRKKGRRGWNPTG